jgi:DNA-binding transcriptional ArsR family regulator
MRKNSSSTKKSSKPEMTPLALELIAARFRALSEPMRLRLLNLLMQGEKSVGALVAAADSSQANVSKHLAVLRESGMIAMRKEGPSTFYRIDDPIVFELCELMCSRLRREIENQSQAIAGL